jgi:hypothetical protein
MKDQFYHTLQVCKRIFEGMGVDYRRYDDGKLSGFSVDYDLWRVEIDPSEPTQICLSFAREVEKEDAVWIAMRFHGLASVLDLEVVSVGSHKRGQD